MLELIILQTKPGDICKLFLDRSNFFGYTIDTYESFYTFTFVVEPKFFEHRIGFSFVDETAFEQIETLKKYLTKFKCVDNYHLKITIDLDLETIHYEE